MCEFIVAWVGKCNKESQEKFCKQHKDIECKCGKQATHECSQTSQFVCGKPLCNECKCDCVYNGYRERLLIELISLGFIQGTSEFCKDNGTESSVILKFFRERKEFLDSVLVIYDDEEFNEEQKKKKILDKFSEKSILVSSSQYEKIFGKNSLLKFSQQFIKLYYQG